MSPLIHLYECYPDIFEDILQRVGKESCKNLFQSCHTFHTSEVFLSRINSAKLFLYDEGKHGSVASQLAAVPRGAHITQLTLVGSSDYRKKAPSFWTAFLQGVVTHMSSWTPGMLELRNITTFKIQGFTTSQPSGSFGGTLHVSVPNLQHIIMYGSDVASLFEECAAAGIQLRSLDLTYPSHDGVDHQHYYNSLGCLTSLRTLKLRTDNTCPSHHLPLTQLTNLTSFHWDMEQYGDDFNTNQNYDTVLTHWQSLHQLSLYHIARRFPPVPTSLRHLHVQFMSSSTFSQLENVSDLFPGLLTFKVDLLLLNCRDDDAMHTALFNLEELQSGEMEVTCGHLRLMCGMGDGMNEKRSLSDVMPVLSRHSRVFAQAGTHDVSAMHVSVRQGELTQLVGLFDGVSKLGLINFHVSSLSVVEEAACIPGLSVLQLRCDPNDPESPSAVHAACMAAQLKRLPLVVECEYYPYLYASYFGEGCGQPEWRDDLLFRWREVTAGLPAPHVQLTSVPCRFNLFPFLDDAFIE